jgi:hypothetical protein
MLYEKYIFADKEKGGIASPARARQKKITPAETGVMHTV